MQQLRKRAIASGCLVVLMGVFACSRPEPRSPIVEKVVDGMCKPVRQNATAQWAESTEGRLCTAARELAFWRGGPVTSDKKTYSPGLK